jgi:endo-1,4-beta-D-glucanase Y
VWDGYLDMAARIFAAGVAPDLFVVDRAGVVRPDTEREPCGSYDAIRVYLWAGMSGRGSSKLIELLAPYAALVRVNGAPPEKVDPRTAAITKADYSPTGFSGALLPFLAAAGDTATLAREYTRARAAAGSGEKTNYFDQALILFGKGWHEGKYRFDEDGRLTPAWAR